MISKETTGQELLDMSKMPCGNVHSKAGGIGEGCYLDNGPYFNIRSDESINAAMVRAGFDIKTDYVVLLGETDRI